MTFIILNSLINGSTNKIFEQLVLFVIQQVLPAIWNIISAPFTQSEMLWIIIPLFISMGLVQLYFARHRNEELGWNTAYENTIALIFVSLNMMQRLSSKYGMQAFNLLNPVTNKIYLIIVLAIVSITQLIINYYHLIPKKIAFVVNSTVPTNTIAFLTIVLIYSNVPLNLSTIIASTIILMLLFKLFGLFKDVVPMSKQAVRYVERMKEKAIRKKAWLEKMSLRQERAKGALLTDAIICIILVILTIAIVVNLEITSAIPLWINYLIQSSSYIIITVIILIKRKLKIRNINYDGELKEFLIGALLGFALFFMIIGVIYLLMLFVPLNDKAALLTFESYYDIKSWTSLLTYLILIPLSSELLFRGVIQRSIKARIGRFIGIHVQALIFSLTCVTSLMLNNYFSFISIPITYLSGMTLGYLRDKWGLESAIGAHLTFNLIGVLI